MSVGIKLSTDQQQALDGILEFISDPSSPQVSRLSGAAGTGKTSVLAEVAKLRDTTVVTPTNRAAGVLRNKGVPASTIHSQIYETLAIKLADQIQALEDSISSLDLREKSGEELSEEEVKLRVRLRERLEQTKTQLEETPSGTYLKFSLRMGAFERRNVLIDESSMVGEKLLKDVLKSNPSKVILVGDENQLPPVKDVPVFQGYNPDWRLTQQHRTGESSGILSVANAIIDGGVVSGWREARQLDSVITEEFNPFGAQEMCDQVSSGALLDQKAVWITHTNRFRAAINRAVRKRMWGEEESLPMEGDILVSRKSIFCRMPEDDGPLFADDDVQSQERDVLKIPNGTFARVIEVIDDDIQDGNIGRRVVLDVDGREIGAFMKQPDFEVESQEGYAPWHYAYCLTAHRAQGSEWDKVVVVGTKSLRRLSDKECNQWVYTAVTRAKKKLVWLRG